MSEPKPIHYCSYASQPDIQIHCTKDWTTPAWNKQIEIKDIYLADSGVLYTFQEHEVTCQKCIEAFSISRFKEKNKAPTREPWTKIFHFGSDPIWTRGHLNETQLDILVNFLGWEDVCWIAQHYEKSEMIKEIKSY